MTVLGLIYIFFISVMSMQDEITRLREENRELRDEIHRLRSELAARPVKPCFVRPTIIDDDVEIIQPTRFATPRTMALQEEGWFGPVTTQEWIGDILPSAQ
jgi:alkylation response protein AidB-like acyl-CoA dehydrogenase